MKVLSWTLMLTLLAAGAFSEVKIMQPENHASFETNGLRAVLGNNAAMGNHRERYNGVFNLFLPGMTESPFVEDYAGLNLEHYFDARPRPKDSDVLFEPRVAPMSFKQLSATSAELHQPPTPVYKTESWTRFDVKGPHYIDMDFRVVAREDVYQGGVLGVFWASYMNAPEDKSLYFLRAGSTLDEPQWEQFSTQQHGVHSSLRHEADDFEVEWQPPNDLLYASDALFRYSEPFYYGRFRDKVVICIFEPGPVVRFTQSPSGGGKSKGRTSNNPAWDFQLIVPNYKVDQEYGMRMRLVYKPWKNRDDVLAEVKKFMVERGHRTASE
jgi:hypothetical protein